MRVVRTVVIRNTHCIDQSVIRAFIFKSFVTLSAVCIEGCRQKKKKTVLSHTRWIATTTTILDTTDSDDASIATLSGGSSSRNRSE